MARSFQDRIKDLEEYRPDITYKDGAFILKIRFNKNWQIVPPKDESEVAYSKDENIPNLHWYASTIENSDILLDLIEETIAVNKEFEKKATLYKEKVKELPGYFPVRHALRETGHDTVCVCGQRQETKQRKKGTVKGC